MIRGRYLSLSLSLWKLLFRLFSSFIVNCLSKYPRRREGLRTVQRHVAGHSAVDKVSVCGTRITTLERSILNNAVKMPILSSFWDWKHFPRLKKRVQPPLDDRGGTRKLYMSLRLRDVTSKCTPFRLSLAGHVCYRCFLP